jgi:hypothetical protein
MTLVHIDSVSESNTFVVTSGALRVTDPCYDMGTWCAGQLDNVMNGIWEAHVGYHDDDAGWGTRVAYLHIVNVGVERHFDHMAEFDSTWEDTGIAVGVDSGQAGFFDLALFSQVCESEAVKEKFYDEVCDLTLGETQWGVHATGCLSSSGYGDGSYDCLVRRVDGQVVEAVIVFLSQYEEEGDLEEEAESDD